MWHWQKPIGQSAGPTRKMTWGGQTKRIKQLEKNKTPQQIKTIKVFHVTTEFQIGADQKSNVQRYHTWCRLDLHLDAIVSVYRDYTIRWGALNKVVYLRETGFVNLFQLISST